MSHPADVTYRQQDTPEELAEMTVEELEARQSELLARLAEVSADRSEDRLEFRELRSIRRRLEDVEAAVRRRVS